MIKSHPLSNSESDLLANACRMLPVHIHTETSTPWNQSAFESVSYAFTQIGSFDISSFHNSSTKHYCPSCTWWSPHFGFSVFLRQKTTLREQRGPSRRGSLCPPIDSIKLATPLKPLLIVMSNSDKCLALMNKARLVTFVFPNICWLVVSLSGSPTHLHLHTKWVGDPG